MMTPAPLAAISRSRAACLAACLLLLGLPMNAIPAAPKRIQPAKEWSGSVENKDLQKLAPEVITAAPQFAELWRAWNLASPVPDVDFEKLIVLVLTTDGSRLTFGASLDDAGNLQVAGMATLDFGPGFRYILAAVSREGVKSVNGKPLSPGFACAFKPKKPADKLSSNPDGSVISIVSESGIGAAAAELTAGRWPGSTIFRFQYRDGRPFDRLEQFKLTTDKFRIEGSRRDTEHMAFFTRDANGQFHPGATVNARVKPSSAALEVTLPPNLLGETKKFDLDWVDAFRG